jgi:hypothetical protein
MTAPDQARGGRRLDSENQPAIRPETARQIALAAAQEADRSNGHEDLRPHFGTPLLASHPGTRDNEGTNGGAADANGGEK